MCDSLIFVPVSVHVADAALSVAITDVANNCLPSCRAARRHRSIHDRGECLKNIASIVAVATRANALCRHFLFVYLVVADFCTKQDVFF